MGRFRDGFGTVSKSGSIGTVLGTLLVPKAEFSPEENQRSERYLREHLGIRSPALLAYPRVALPPCPRTLEYLCRSKPPYGSANFGGSPRAKGTREMADLVGSDTRRSGRDAACRSDPTFTRASPGLAVAEQLPQIIIIIIIIKIRRPNGEALEILRRPTAGQQGRCGGAAPPRPTSISILSLILILIF